MEAAGFDCILECKSECFASAGDASEPLKSGGNLAWIEQIDVAADTAWCAFASEGGQAAVE